MTSASSLGTLKRSYATGMQHLGQGLRRVHALPDAPPPRSERFRHWAFSLTSIHNSLAMVNMDVPWWTYNAIDAVEVWIDGHARPIRAFEYGSGASTVWLGKRLDEVHSVEHHEGFAELMAPVVAEFPTVDLRVVPATPSSAPRVASAKEDHGGLDFADYVHSINQVGGQFDLVIIDGRAREACLTEALKHLAAGGLIVFDNSRRARYRVAIADAGVRETAMRGWAPTLPYPDQTSLIRPA